MTGPTSNPRFVYQWTDHGFFSEANHMLLAILYCRLHGKQFVLSSRHAPVFPAKGWRDFFHPFGPETENPILRFLDSRPLVPLRNLKARLSGLDKRVRRSLLRHVVQPLFYPGVDVLCRHWHAVRALRDQDTFVLPTDGVPRQYSLREALHSINNQVWRYNDQTGAAIDASIAGLALPQRYAALHIRRGDVHTFAERIDEVRYVERLEHVTSLQDVYVATDDVRAVETIRRLRPRWRVWSLCPATMRGYFPKDYDSQPREERGRRTLLLLTETEVMRRAEVFVGTFSSGIGTYQGIARTQQTSGVDVEQWRFEGCT